jgi:hypothetical protein
MFSNKLGRIIKESENSSSAEERHDGMRITLYIVVT